MKTTYLFPALILLIVGWLVFETYQDHKARKSVNDGEVIIDKEHDIIYEYEPDLDDTHGGPMPDNNVSFAPNNNLVVEV